jgi:hypothetical protein
MAPMIGKVGKPFCGNCCSEYRQGSGKKHKRIQKQRDKAREKRAWKDAT